MKKTLFVMFDFPPREGGAQRYNWDMINALPRDQVIILSPAWGNWQDFDLQSGYRTYRLPWGWMEKMKIPFLIGILPYIVWKNNIEYIWFSKYSRAIGPATLFVSAFFKIPFGLTVFGEDLAFAAQDFGLNLPTMAIRLRDSVLKKADKIVCNSGFSATLLPPNLSFSVIHPCLPSSANKLIPTQRRNRSTIIFLSVGQLVKRKGFDLVIQALAEGLPDVPSFRYILCGGGPYEVQLLELIEKYKMRHVVEMMGPVDEKEKDRLFREADVFVMPSRIEGFGIVFLEAALYLLCSIGSRSGGIPEVIQDRVTGILVDNENIEDIRRALNFLGSNFDVRKEMGKRAETRCRNNFLWDRFAHEWKGVFDTL